MIQQNSKVRRLVLEACQRKGFSIRQLAKAAGISNHSQVSRALNGKTPLSRETLTKWCNALECTLQERTQIFHAAGYLAPEEIDEEKSAA